MSAIAGLQRSAQLTSSSARRGHRLLMAAANFSLHSPDKVNTKNTSRGPLLLTMGKQDRTVPEVITKSTLKQHRHSDAVTDLEEFDRGHSLTIDPGWRDVAGSCLTWLNQQGL